MSTCLFIGPYVFFKNAPWQTCEGMWTHELPLTDYHYGPTGQTLCGIKVHDTACTAAGNSETVLIS